MKKQDKIDGQNPKQIFNTNFHSEVHVTRTNHAFFSNIQLKLPLIVVGALLFLCFSCVIMAGFYLRLHNTGEHLIGNWSLSRFVSEERQNRQLIEADIAEAKTNLSDTGRDIDKLKVSGALDTLPDLAVARGLYTEKINWFRAYVGIDQVIKQLVSANDILKKITIGSIYFDQTNKTVLLENVRAYGTYYGVNQDTKSGSSISLAAGIVDTFEQSIFFKDIHVDEYTRKQEVGSGTTLTEFFTPLTIHATIQEADEANAKDKKISIENELQSLSPATPDPTTH